MPPTTHYFRAPRGRVLHRQPDCRRLHGSVVLQTDERRACDRRCVLCFPEPVCLVCHDEGPDVVQVRGCPHGHAVCLDCLAAFTKIQIDNGGSMPPTCPCGRGALDMQRELRPAAFSQCMQHFNAVQHDARRPLLLTLLRGGGLLDALQDEAHALRCPSCGWRFVDFDGCAAISCACGVSFCALCFECFTTANEAHAHLRDECTLNPFENEFFVPLEVCRRVWQGRARVRANALCRHVARRDGVLLALLLRALLAWRQLVVDVSLRRFWAFVKGASWMARGMWRVVGADDE